jgi:hypothetical protein
MRSCKNNVAVEWSGEPPDVLCQLLHTGTETHKVRAVIVTAMSLPSGTKLGPYEILAPHGAGGMGEGYRAPGYTPGPGGRPKAPAGTVARATSGA